MGKVVDFKANKVREIPEGSKFVQLSEVVIGSASWRLRPINVAKLMDVLFLEHMAHAGLENGFLLAPYNQLEGAGIPRRLIRQTIEIAEALGLIEVRLGMRQQFGRYQPTTYRLTFLREKRIDNKGRVYFAEPTHEYTKVTEQEAREVIRKTRSKGSQVKPKGCHKVNRKGVTSETLQRT